MDPIASLPWPAFNRPHCHPSASSWAANSTASRVLPDPPGPVINRTTPRLDPRAHDLRPRSSAMRPVNPTTWRSARSSAAGLPPNRPGPVLSAAGRVNGRITARRPASTCARRSCSAASSAARRSRRLMATGTTRPAAKTTAPASPAHTRRCQAWTPVAHAPSAVARHTTVMAPVTTSHSRCLDAGEALAILPPLLVRVIQCGARGAPQEDQATKTAVVIELNSKLFTSGQPDNSDTNSQILTTPAHRHR